MPPFNNTQQAQQRQQQLSSDLNSSGGAQTAAPVRAIPFKGAAFTHREQGRSQSYTMSAAGGPQTQLDVPVYGYLKVIYLRFTAVAAGNAAAVAFKADAPWNAVKSIILRDNQGTNLVNLSGYDLYLAATLGGYRQRPLDQLSGYSTTTGVGAGAGGSFSFILPIYLEFMRDGVGSLPNMDASAPYRIDLTPGSLSDVYSTAPTNAPVVTVDIFVEAYQNPPAMDIYRVPQMTTPPMLGSAQFWTYSTYAISGAGDQYYLLPRVGNRIRNLILEWYDNTGARSNAMFPSGNLTFEFDALTLESIPPTLRRDINERMYNFAMPTGVTTYTYTDDPDNIPGAEWGDLYLKTLGSSRVGFRFTAPAAGTLRVLLNDVYLEGSSAEGRA